VRARQARAQQPAPGARGDREALFDGVDISEQLTGARFEELNSDLFRKTMVPVKTAMADAGAAEERRRRDRARRGQHQDPQGAAAAQGLLQRQGA